MSEHDEHATHAPPEPDRTTRPGATGAHTQSVPARLGSYHILRVLGQGGMGVVYLARHADLDKHFAIKFLAPTLAGSEKAVEQFVEEARKAAKLNHPSIVQVVDLQREDGRTYIVSEFVDGPTLTRVIATERAAHRDHPDTPRLREWIRRAAEITAALADALDCAHRAGIVHCDVKPSNVLMDPLRGPRLSDFGIARYLASDSTARHTSSALTPWYASPEQASTVGAPIDQRSDVFSLGVVLFEMLAFRVPFDGKSVAAVLQAVAQADAPKLRPLNSLVPADLETICRKAIEKEPIRRYQSAAHLAADLRSFLRGDPILATPPSLARRVARAIRRHRKPVVLASIAALALIIVGLLTMMQARARAALSWISIDPQGNPCSIRLQPVDPRTLQLRPPTISTFFSRAERFGVEPGHYRLTVIGQPASSAAGARPASQSEPAPAFAELDLLLLNRGAATPVRVIRADQHFPREPNLLVARLSVAPSVPDETVALVDAGTYIVGNDPQDPIVQRRQTVTLAAFTIDKLEVSNAQYLDFLYQTSPSPEATRRLDSIVRHDDLDQPGTQGDRYHHPHTPDFWKTSGYDPALADRPVVGVRARDAAAYARWIGKRLPTSFEWEAAARGPSGLRAADRMDFPPGAGPPDYGGISPDARFLRLDQARDPDSRLRIYRELSVPVDTPDPLATPSGIRWMFGNAREITSTVELENRDGVAKGRCWLDEPKYAPFGVAWTFPITERYYDRGFRCARSVAPVDPPAPASP